MLTTLHQSKKGLALLKIGSSMTQGLALGGEDVVGVTLSPCATGQPWCGLFLASYEQE